MRRIAAAGVLALLFAAPAFADDVSDALAEAQKAYSAGDLASTKQSLDLAGQLVAQKQGDALAKLLPEPPAGWTAGDVDSSGGLAGVIGGGLIVKRDYDKDGKQATVQLMANSPILGSLAPLFANVQLLGGMGKVFRQKGKTAVTTDEGEIQMVLGKSYLTISGSAPEADKRALLDLVDLQAVEKFSK